MTISPVAKDLLVLTADTHMRSTVDVLLQHRRPALGISDLTADVIRHPDSDPGCRSASAKLLNPLRDKYRKAMVLFDFDGCGTHHTDPMSLERDLERQYYDAGWRPDSVAFVVIAPELETWMFGASHRNLERVLRWSQPVPLRDWFEAEGYLPAGSTKPEDPKATINAALNRQKTQISAKLFADLARNASLARCQDRAFQKLCNTLRRWFPDR